MKLISEVYEDLFNAMMSGLSHCRAIYDINGKMIDWIFITVNLAFREQSGIKEDPTGKTVNILIPTLYERNPELFERYERVARSGKAERFETYIAPLQKHFDVSVYSVQIDTFTIIFDDITEAKTQAHKLRTSNEATVMAFVSSLQTRDNETQEHTVRVSEMAVQFGQRLAMNEAELQDVRRGALLHDIGKIGISDLILLKPSALTETEMDIMKKHPKLGYDLLTKLPFLRDASIIPYCHHEKWDGSGYPRGLIGEEIPFMARMFAIVDVYDALTSDRPYRKAWPQKLALDHLEKESGKSFDPMMVLAFIELVEAEMLGL